jgi:hypothetical protein
MAEKRESGSQAGAEFDPLSEERFRYIGFNVFSGKAREFWKDDSERQAHLAHVRESGGRFVPLSRSNSLVAARAISAPERWMLTATSALMALSPLLPWFSFTRGSEKLSYSGLSLLFHAGAIRQYLALGPGLLNTSFLLLLVLMLASSALGIAALWFLYAGGNGQGSDAYLLRLHKIMTWHYLPILGWMVFFALTAPSTVMPYGASLGLAEVGDHLGVGPLAGASSVGLWIPLGTLWVNAIKGNDL